MYASPASTAPATSAVTSAAPTAARSVTRPLPAPLTPAELIAALPQPTGALCFTRADAGLVGFGAHASLRVDGPGAAARIESWYREVLAGLTVDDGVGVPGSGPLCFVSLGFADTDASVAIVPRTVLGTVDGVSFRTDIGPVPPAGAAQDPVPASVRAPGAISYADADMSAAEYTATVTEAIGRIRAGDAEKIVLAHGLAARTEFDVDERFLLARLFEQYPSCTAFAAAGLVGASPETLLHRRGTTVASRVLAGTAWPDRGDAAADDDVAAHLLANRKQLAEHAFSVRSVADVLREVTTRLDVPERPRALPLANLTHLATDVVGTLAADAPSALQLAARLHPTAAVGGTPKARAQELIAELEPIPRGRYAAPTGWFDAAGDGEFVIALRCAQVEGRTVTMMAGCGIVADSVPQTEAREAQVKMVPIRDALESRG